MTITPSGATQVVPDDNDPTTGQRVTVDADGQVVSSEPVTGLPMPPIPADELLDATDPRDTSQIRRT